MRYRFSTSPPKSLYRHHPDGMIGTTPHEDIAELHSLESLSAHPNPSLAQNRSSAFRNSPALHPTLLRCAATSTPRHKDLVYSGPITVANPTLSSVPLCFRALQVTLSARPHRTAKSKSQPRNPLLCWRIESRNVPFLPQSPASRETIECASGRVVPHKPFAKFRLWSCTTSIACRPVAPNCPLDLLPAAQWFRAPFLPLISAPPLNQIRTACILLRDAPNVFHCTSSP